MSTNYQDNIIYNDAIPLRTGITVLRIVINVLSGVHIRIDMPFMHINSFQWTLSNIELQQLKLYFEFRFLLMSSRLIWRYSGIQSVKCYVKLLFRAQEPLGSSDLLWSRVVRRPSVVRPSVVRRPLNYLHFRLLLQNHLMDFDETWYGWSTQGPLQVLLFFGQIRRGADPGRGKNRSRGVPFFKKLLLQSGRLQQQTECIAVI